jgi:hypothetical protein
MAGNAFGVPKTTRAVAMARRRLFPVTAENLPNLEVGASLLKNATAKKGDTNILACGAGSTTVVAQWGVLAGSGYDSTEAGPKRLFPETFKRCIIRAARVLRDYLSSS